jgi:hypothetical protein
VLMPKKLAIYEMIGKKFDYSNFNSHVKEYWQSRSIRDFEILILNLENFKFRNN